MFHSSVGRISEWGGVKMEVQKAQRGVKYGKLPSHTPPPHSIDTIALNCLVFEKIAFLHFAVKIQDGGSPLSWILGVP